MKPLTRRLRVYTIIQLNLMSAPVVSVYPAAEGPRKLGSGRTDPAKYDFSSGFDPAPLAEQLSHHTPIPIPYRAPINWGKIGATTFSAATFLLFIRFFKPILAGRFVWIIMTVVPSLAFMGGLMFVQIRGSAWQMPNGQWMAQGYSNQLGKEVQMIAIICESSCVPHGSLMLIVIPQMVPWLALSLPLSSSHPMYRLHASEYRSIPWSSSSPSSIPHCSASSGSKTEVGTAHPSCRPSADVLCHHRLSVPAVLLVVQVVRMQ